MERLFVYGTLQPGAPNEHVLAGAGSWRPAELLGELAEAGWGAAQGYPGLVSVGSGNAVAGQLLEANHLDWEALDRFEGDDYVRRSVDVTLSDGSSLVAQVYVLSCQVKS